MGFFSWIRNQHSERKAARASGASRRHYYRRRYRTSRRSVRSDDTEYYSADEHSISGASPRAPAIAEEDDAALGRWGSGGYPSDDDGVVAQGDKIIVHPTPERRASGCMGPVQPSISGKRLVLEKRPSVGQSFSRRSVGRLVWVGVEGGAIGVRVERVWRGLVEGCMLVCVSLCLICCTGDDDSLSHTATLHHTLQHCNTHTLQHPHTTTPTGCRACGSGQQLL